MEEYNKNSTNKVKEGNEGEKNLFTFDLFKLLIINIMRISNKFLKGIISIYQTQNLLEK